MSDPKKPTDKAKESLERGVGELFRAAESFAGAVKRESKKTGGIGKAFDDAGREIVRAASNVATYVGSELETWGKKAQETLEAEPAEAPSPAAGTEAPAAAAAGEDPKAEPWPKSRDEFERVYGPLEPGEEWPKNREAYVEQFGRPPLKRGGDPGFRIATDDSTG